jgi:hypothetical protein
VQIRGSRLRDLDLMYGGARRDYSPVCVAFIVVCKGEGGVFGSSENSLDHDM